MKVFDAQDFVRSLELPEPGPRLRGKETPIAFGHEQEAFTIGAQIAEFSGQVEPSQRAAVSDCLLLAQLAANKATAQNTDQMIWYRKYVEVLENVGWTVESFFLEDKKIKNLDLDVHQAITPVLAEMLGPSVAVASLVIGVLNGLKEMDNDNPWITVFDRASQHASGAKFQFGYVDSVGGESPAITIRLLAVAIDANRTITQVLFFKFSDQDANLRTSESRLGIVASRLDSIKAAVAERVLPFLTENIKKLDI